jgi:hypothetical protein
MKNVEKQQSVELRKQGWSIKKIASHVNVAKSSVSVWVRDIALTEEQKLGLEQNVRKGVLKSIQTKIKNCREIRNKYQSEGKEHAKNLNPLHLAGCMLYWAEGGKDKNTVAFSNSDINMVRFFKRFMDGCYELAPEDYRIHCNFYTDIHTQEDVEQYWLQQLDLPRSCLRKSTVNYHSRYSQNKKKAKSEYGVCKLVVHKTKIVQHIFGAIQGYAAFEDKKWLK